MNTVGRSRMGTITRRVVLLTGLMVTTGCLAIPLGRRQGSPPLERSSALEHKKVAQKEEPNLLLAADRTWCEVGRKKFESVKKGDAVWCVWRR